MQESFCHKFRQNPFNGYGDNVIFMFCAIFSNGRWQPSWNAKMQKNRKGSMTGPFWHKISPIPLRFSNFHIFSNRDQHDCQYLVTFEALQCKNHFATNFVKTHSVVTELLSFSCFGLFLVMTDGSHHGMPKCKNQNGSMTGPFWHKISPNSIEIFLFSHFAIFSNRDQHDWSIFSYVWNTSMQESFFFHKFCRNSFNGYGDNVIFMFLGYFSNGRWQPSRNAKRQKKSKRLHKRTILKK